MRKVKVILLEKIKRLGNIGETAFVKAGYARNFLVPQKKAWYFSQEKADLFENKKAFIEAQDVKKLEEMIQLSKRFEDFSLEIKQHASGNGVLYGSISKSVVVKALADNGFADVIDILKDAVDISQQIKLVGSYQIPLQLHHDLRIEFTLRVVAG